MRLITNKSRNPTHIDEHNWIYSNNARSLLLIHEKKDGQCDHITIPLKLIEQIVKEVKL